MSPYPAGDEKNILDTLLYGEIELQGQFVLGFNYTFLVKVNGDHGNCQAVYKPTRGEQPLWDFPPQTLARREKAAWLVSESLGWKLVPPTVLREAGPIGGGSLQLFIEHDPQLHYFNFKKDVQPQLRRAALFDLIINNADRKGGHMLQDVSGKIWLIDHGLCFHPEEKLRTVIWDFAGEAIPGELIKDMEPFLRSLQEQEVARHLLAEHLSQEEITAMVARCQVLLEKGKYPLPPADRRVIPYPPI